MKILIKITQEIINKSSTCMAGKKYQNNCAVALAVRELFPYASVYRNCIVLGGGSYTSKEAIDLPEEAEKFIETFDRIGKISSTVDTVSKARIDLLKPFNFELDIPSDMLFEMINISEVYKILSESKTLELVHP